MIFYVSNSIETAQNTDAIFINYFIFNVFDITPVEGAKTYEATIVEHNPGRSYVGRRSSFQADDPNDLTDGVYRIRTSFFSGSIPKDHPDAASDLSARMSEGLASIGAISGLVKVVVTLVP